MAKKKPTAASSRRANVVFSAVASAADGATSHVSAGYKLTMPNSDTAFRVELNVTGEDGQQYHLRVRDPADRPALVKKALRIMADFWPAFNWPFRAGDDREISDIGAEPHVS
jgi:hypothetical protein